MIVLHKFELFEAAVSLLYPPVCAACGDITDAGEYLCERCERKAMRIVAPFCQQCSEPFEGAIAGAFTLRSAPGRASEQSQVRHNCTCAITSNSAAGTRI